MKIANPMAVALTLLAPMATAQEVRSWKDVPRPPLRDFRPAVPRRIVLPNGMVIFLQEDRELPLVSGTLRVRGGSREEPAAKVGLTSLYGSAWRTGGTKTKTGDELDDFLEARAAKVETSTGTVSTTVGWSCLKDNLDEVFAVVLDVLKNPELREDKITLARRQVETSITRRNDDASGIANREAARLGYGADSPYGRIPELATVRAVTRDDLLAWHREFVHPNNFVLGVVGDFDTKAMETRLRRAFESWPKGPAARRTPVEVPGPKPGVYLVDKSDVNQSNVRLVHTGIRRDDPDYYAAEVLNQILGGGFSGRLLTNVRTKKGLAYGVWGSLGSAFDRVGLLSLGLGTKSESTAAGIDAVLEEVQGVLGEPPSAEEMARAKDALLNSFIFSVDTPEKMLFERMTYELFGYPLDLLERYRPAIEKVTAQDVLAVARKHIHVDKLAIVVVGRAQDFDRPLSSFGPVSEIDVHIPPPPAPAAAP